MRCPCQLPAVRAGGARKAGAEIEAEQGNDAWQEPQSWNGRAATLAVPQWTGGQHPAEPYAWPARQLQLRNT
jgi:hypothetical protein